MSDRDTILGALIEIAGRLRARRALERATRYLAIWIGLGLLITAFDLIWPIGPVGVRILEVGWIIGAAALLALGFRTPVPLGRAAADVDLKIHLQDEILSAWWFIKNDTDSTPWVRLHVRRAAEKVRAIDVSRLYPSTLPRMSGIVGMGLVLLVGLHLAPLRLPSAWVISGPLNPPDVLMASAAESLMSEIEGLLERADALRPDGTLDTFRDLMNGLNDPEVPLPEIASDLERLEDTLEEGNLSTAGILEGLEDMAAELMGAADTAAAGEALAGGRVRDAAAELGRLGEALAGGEPGGEELSSALDRAAEESRPGLEALAQNLADAASSLRDQDLAEAGAQLEQAASSLGDLSDLLESQNLKNQAAERIEDLQEALTYPGEGQGEEPGRETPESGQGSEPRAGGAQSPGDQTGAGEPNQAGPSPPQEGTGEGSESGSGDPAGSGEPQADGVPGAGQDAGLGGTGLTPAGIGFSPGEQIGPPTSLEVQLEQDGIRALASETEQSDLPSTPEEEASRQERSRLDYRLVPSDLSPAQQELLNRERIPREYQNLIREYLQAIRPPVTP